MASGQWRPTASSWDSGHFASDGGTTSVRARTLGVEVDGGARSTASSASAEADETLLAKIQAFSDQREEERKRMFRRVVRVFYALLIVGGAGSLASGATKMALPGNDISPMINVVAFTLVVWGVVIGSACPLDMLDIDETYKKHAMKFSLIWLAAAVNAVGEVFDFPHVDGLEILIAVGGVMSGYKHCLPSWWPAPSFWGPVYHIVDMSSWGVKQLLPHLEPENPKVPPLAARVYGGVAVLCSALTLGRWLWRRRQFSQRRSQCGPWMQYYEVLYAWCFALAVTRGIQGGTWLVAPQPGFVDTLNSSMLVLRSVLMLIPTLTILILGRHRLFHLLGQSFDSDGARLQRDGAFVAELLEAVTVDVGQTWWVHRDQPDGKFPLHDPQRNWQQGFVVELSADSGEFVVRLPTQEDVPLELPSAGASKSKEDLLLQAQRELRCVEFEKLSLDLMTRDRSRMDPEQEAAWRELSRPVRQGEQIDFFMSQSWYDDPEKKWEKIVEVASRFHQRHGRYPTFWLDKLCIDQAAITDGLRCLPVNVMACRKLLALCGDTYTSRLWCIWELFTLFAFVNEAAALERVEFAFLGTHEEGLSMLDAMANFHVSEAHCYDPNVEARLRRVIDAVGTGRFNKRISNLALATRELLEQEASNKSISSRTSLPVTGVLSWAKNKALAQKQLPEEEEGMPAV